jgi:hypothetical protein
MEAEASGAPEPQPRRSSTQEAHLMFLYMVDDVRSYLRCADDAAVCTTAIELCEADLVRRRGGEKLSGVLQYDAADLLNFLDIHCAELVVLRYLPAERRYEPQGRDWMKNLLYQYLLNMAPALE